MVQRAGILAGGAYVEVRADLAQLQASLSKLREMGARAGQQLAAGLEPGLAAAGSKIARLERAAQKVGATPAGPIGFAPSLGMAAATPWEKTEAAGAATAAKAAAEQAARASRVAAQEVATQSAAMRGAMSSMMIGGALLAAVGMGISRALTNMAKRFADASLEMTAFGQKYQMTVQQAQAMQYTAKQTGISVDALAVGLRRMNKTVSDATEGEKKATDALSRLGMTAAQFTGMDTVSKLKLLADGFGTIADKGQMAIEIFGRSGTAIIPLLEQGGAGVDAYMKKLEEAGAIISDDVVASLAALARIQQTTHMQWEAAKAQISGALVPLLTVLAKILGAVAGAFKAVAAYAPELITVVVVFGAMVGAVGALALAAGTLAFAFNSIKIAIIGCTTAMKIFDAVSSASVIGFIAKLLVTIAIAAGVLQLLDRLTGAGAGGGEEAKGAFDAAEAAERASAIKEEAGAAIDAQYEIRRIKQEGIKDSLEKQLTAIKLEADQKLAKLALEAKAGKDVAKDIARVKMVEDAKVYAAREKHEREIFALQVENAFRLAEIQAAGIQDDQVRAERGIEMKYQKEFDAIKARAAVRKPQFEAEQGAIKTAGLLERTEMLGGPGEMPDLAGIVASGKREREELAVSAAAYAKSLAADETERAAITARMDAEQANLRMSYFRSLFNAQKAAERELDGLRDAAIKSSYLREIANINSIWSAKWNNARDAELAAKEAARLKPDDPGLKKAAVAAEAARVAVEAGADQATANAEAARASREAETTRKLDDEIKVAELRATLKGKDLDLALLNLEKEQAIREANLKAEQEGRAKASPADIARIEKLYGLKQAALDASTRSPFATGTAVGSGAAAIMARGTGAESILSKQLRFQEKIAEYTRRMADGKGLAFT